MDIPFPRTPALEVDERDLILPTQTDNMRLLLEAYASSTSMFWFDGVGLGFELGVRRIGWQVLESHVRLPTHIFYVIHRGESCSCPLPAPNEGRETASSYAKADG